MTEASSDPGAVFVFGILSLLVLIIAYKRDFFSFPQSSIPWIVPIRWTHVVGIFAIYFGIALLISPLLGPFFRREFLPENPLGYMSWINFLNSFLIAASIAFFASKIPREIRQKIWRRSENSAYQEDTSFAFSAWLVSFPLVLFLSQLLDLLLSSLFHVREVPEQLAVQFLKMTFASPLYLSLSIATIVLFAPIIEETLFRGFLQTFIRQHLGSKQAIGITSLLFAFFHYSPEQGLGNIPIVGSLLALALFLGFVYEKRGSLFASIVLHATFNSISVLNLYFLGGFPKGPL